MFVISMVFAQDVDENNVVMSIIVEENAKKLLLKCLSINTMFLKC